MHWKADGIGEQESGENHLYVVSSEGGSAKISTWGLDYVIVCIGWIMKLWFFLKNEPNDLLVMEATGIFKLM